MAAEPELATSGFTFTLSARYERGELVAVCKTLLELGVLMRVECDEEGFVRAGGDVADEEAPPSIDARLGALADEHVADSDDARRTAVRRHLSRRLLDDPVIYVDSLDDEMRAYFMNQRGTLAARLADGTGLGIEQRAEGAALVDTSGDFTDIAMPAEGTDANANRTSRATISGGSSVRSIKRVFGERHGDRRREVPPIVRGVEVSFGEMKQ